MKLPRARVRIWHLVKMVAASPAAVEGSGPAGRREGMLRRLLNQYDKNGNKTYEEPECVAHARAPRPGGRRARR